MSNGSIYYITARDNKHRADFKSAPEGNGDVDQTDKLYNANPKDKKLSETVNGWTLNRQMGEAINAIVAEYNVMKHGSEGADAFIIQWRLWPNADSDYIKEYGYGGSKTKKDAAQEEEHGGCGCGCGG